MARYCIDGLRSEIRQALQVTSRTRGQLDGFEGLGYSDKYARRTTRNECGVSVQNEVVRTIACRTYKNPALPIPFNTFAHTALVKKIKAAPSPNCDWLVYCYSDGALMPTADLLRDVIHRFNCLESKKITLASTTLIKHLALLACQQSRLSLNYRDTEMLTQVRIAELSGKSIKTWEASWAKRWKRLLSLIEQIDSEALDYVYESGRSGKNTRKHTDMLMSSRATAATGVQMATRMAV